MYMLGSLIGLIGFLVPFWLLVKGGDAGVSVRTVELMSSRQQVRGFDIDLTPEMNAIHFVPSAHMFEGESLPDSAWYRAALYLGKIRIHEESLHFKPGPGSRRGASGGDTGARVTVRSTVRHIATTEHINIEAAGRYHYVVEGVGSMSQTKSPLRMQVEVRRNSKASRFQFSYILWGAGIMAFGWILTLFGEKPDWVRERERQSV